MEFDLSQARIRASIAVALGAGAVAAGAVSASAATPADPGQARLIGPFLLSARITSVAGVPGENRGDVVLRTWTFQPQCSVGACPTLTLIRERPGGADRLRLTAAGPGVYSGTGHFYVPLRCGRRTYTRGQLVPFSVIARVTAAELVNGVDLATAVSATYVSRSRTNLTRCVVPPAHEAATYQGNLIAA